MDIFDICVKEIKSVIEHKRTVEVIIDYDLFGLVKDHHCAFLKEDWTKIKATNLIRETKMLDINGMNYFEQMPDAEWYSRHFAAHLKDFSDEEIVEEFNRRMNDRLFHHIKVNAISYEK